MPTRKDGTGRRWVEMEFVVPGTPEQVWQAMATGPGNAAWFTRATIEERAGGEIRFDFGGGATSSGEVTAWEPPHRFAYVESGWMEGAPPVATEITIAGRSGGQSVVRMVHSLFASTDDWDDQLEGFEAGWPSFFDVLRIYLSGFDGKKAASFQAFVNSDGDPLAVWTRLTEALGLTAANVGEQRSTPPLPQALSGVVESVQQDRRQRLILMRLDTPTPGAALLGICRHGAHVMASVSLFFYGDDADATAAASEPRWRDWLGQVVTPAA
jgi:uncharacterized protein YndB with AHSA1/START domain